MFSHFYVFLLEFVGLFIPNHFNLQFLIIEVKNENACYYLYSPFYKHAFIKYLCKWFFL